MTFWKVTINQRIEGKGYSENIVVEFGKIEEALVFMQEVMENTDSNTTCDLDRRIELPHIDVDPLHPNCYINDDDEEVEF